MSSHLSLASLLCSPRTVEAATTGPGPSPAHIASTLTALRRVGRRSLRILDLDCGNGQRLLRTAAAARELGFVAIECRGIDPSPANIRRARHQAVVQAHPTTSLIFEIGDPIAALAGEHDADADLILISQALPYPCSPLRIALERVGTGTVLGAE